MPLLTVSILSESTFAMKISVALTIIMGTFRQKSSKIEASIPYIASRSSLVACIKAGSCVLWLVIELQIDAQVTPSGSADGDGSGEAEVSGEADGSGVAEGVCEGEGEGSGVALTSGLSCPLLGSLLGSALGETDAVTSSLCMGLAGGLGSIAPLVQAAKLSSIDVVSSRDNTFRIKICNLLILLHTRNINSASIIQNFIAIL